MGLVITVTGGQIREMFRALSVVAGNYQRRVVAEDVGDENAKEVSEY